jgi:hypothetical protein
MDILLNREDRPRSFGERTIAHVGRNAWHTRSAWAALIFGLIVWRGGASGDAAEAAVVTTDKPDYSPAETVHVIGTGFAAATRYDVPVIRPDGSIVKGDGSFTPGWDNTLTDGLGNFTYLYQLDEVVGTYTVLVYPFPWSGDLTEVPVATTTFTDNVQTDFRQCANHDPTLGDCHWIGSILNNNDSDYFEGMSVPQRILLDQVDATTGNVHTLTFEHDATKGGVHAYDFLTSYSQAATESLSTPAPFNAGPKPTRSTRPAAPRSALSPRPNATLFAPGPTASTWRCRVTPTSTRQTARIPRASPRTRPCSDLGRSGSAATAQSRHSR